MGAGPPLPAGHPGVSHQAPDFCNFGLAKGLWDLLSCLPPHVLPLWYMVAQEPLAGGSSPLPGVQTATAPWLGFPSCLMAAGALNLSRGPSWVLRAGGGSAIPAMCPLSRDQQGGETLNQHTLRVLRSRGQSRGEAAGPPARRQFPGGISAALLPGLQPPSLQEGRELRGCAPRLQLCLQRQGQAARWHLQQHRGTPAPHTEEWPGAPGQRVMEGTHSWQAAVGLLAGCTGAVQMAVGQSAERWDWGRLQDRVLSDLG